MIKKIALSSVVMISSMSYLLQPVYGMDEEAWTIYHHKQHVRKKTNERKNASFLTALFWSDNVKEEVRAYTNIPHDSVVLDDEQLDEDTILMALLLNCRACAIAGKITCLKKKHDNLINEHNNLKTENNKLMFEVDELKSKASSEDHTKKRSINNEKEYTHDDDEDYSEQRNKKKNKINSDKLLQIQNSEIITLEFPQRISNSLITSNNQQEEEANKKKPVLQSLNEQKISQKFLDISRNEKLDN